jgi:hypothetical protein
MNKENRTGEGGSRNKSCESRDGENMGSTVERDDEIRSCTYVVILTVFGSVCA